MDINLLSLVPSGSLFKMMQKKFTKLAGFEVSEAVITVDFNLDIFQMELKNPELKKQIRQSGKASEFTDLSDILLTRVKKKIIADTIDNFKLSIDLIKKTTVADLWYIGKENKGDSLSIPLYQQIPAIF